MASCFSSVAAAQQLSAACTLPEQAAAVGASSSGRRQAAALNPSRLNTAVVQSNRRWRSTLPVLAAAAGAQPTVSGAAQRRSKRSIVCNAVSEETEVIDVAPVDTRVPVTVITGFLGSGKTTLLNHILSANHGRRIAVIENEFGEIDIDGDLVAAQQNGAEDILMLNNGCLCCTVRGDLVRMMTDLVYTKKDKFDHIIIETTGVANPVPVIQSFYLDARLLEHVKLDGVVTVVDAVNIERHLVKESEDEPNSEAVDQIAFADRLILNKTDLINDSARLDNLERKIKTINGLARLKRAVKSDVDVDYVLGIGGFDLDRVESEILEAEAAEAHDHDHKHEHSHEHDHHHDHEHGPDCAPDCEQHDHGHKHEHEHNHEHTHAHAHTHNPDVTSVSLRLDGELDLDKVNYWLGALIEDGADTLYRMKGGVHQLFDGMPERPWGPDEKRASRLVFIGKKLNEAELRAGFEKCLADQ
eukprot:jgi/Chlat1/3246/Chrsp22S03433